MKYFFKLKIMEKSSLWRRSVKFFDLLVFLQSNSFYIQSLLIYLLFLRIDSIDSNYLEIEKIILSLDVYFQYFA